MCVFNREYNNKYKSKVKFNNKMQYLLYPLL